MHYRYHFINIYDVFDMAFITQRQQCHAMRFEVAGIKGAWLSHNLLNTVAIILLEFRLKLNEIFIKFQFREKNFNEIGNIPFCICLNQSAVR